MPCVGLFVTCLVDLHRPSAGFVAIHLLEQPRQLMSVVAGLALTEMENTDVCCGFGDTFGVNLPDISERIITDKVALSTLKNHLPENLDHYLLACETRVQANGIRRMHVLLIAGHPE